MSTQLDERVPADTLGLRLVIARVHAGHYNAASAALACGINRQTWSNWERGKPISHRDANLALIAERLGVSEQWLRDGGPLREPGPDYDPGSHSEGWGFESLRARNSRLTLVKRVVESDAAAA